MNKTAETTVVCLLGALLSESTSQSVSQSPSQSASQSVSQSVSQLVLFNTTDLYQVDPGVLITCQRK